MHIYYLLENTQQCKLTLSNYGTIIYGNGKTNSSATSFNMKIRSTQKNCAIKRGLGRKNHAGKISQQIRDEKCAMCAWDH